MKRFNEKTEWQHIVFDCVAATILFSSVILCGLLLLSTYYPELFK